MQTGYALWMGHTLFLPFGCEGIRLPTPPCVPPTTPGTPGPSGKRWVSVVQLLKKWHQFSHRMAKSEQFPSCFLSITIPTYGLCYLSTFFPDTDRTHPPYAYIRFSHGRFLTGQKDIRYSSCYPAVCLYQSRTRLHLPVYIPTSWKTECSVIHFLSVCHLSPSTAGRWPGHCLRLVPQHRADISLQRQAKRLIPNHHRQTVPQHNPPAAPSAAPNFCCFSYHTIPACPLQGRRRRFSQFRQTDGGQAVTTGLERGPPKRTRGPPPEISQKREGG